MDKLFLIFLVMAVMSGCNDSINLPANLTSEPAITLIELNDSEPKANGQFGLCTTLLSSGKIAVQSSHRISLYSQTNQQTETSSPYQSHTKHCLEELTHGSLAVPNQQQHLSLFDDRLNPLHPDIPLLAYHRLVMQYFNQTAGNISLATITALLNSFSTYINTQQEAVISILSNERIVLTQSLADASGIPQAGTVTLIDASTGISINTLQGDNASDHLGHNGITELANGNFTIASSDDDISGIINAGSIKLINGRSGSVIKSIQGNFPRDRIGLGGVTALANGHFVIASPRDTVSQVSYAGSVQLVDGYTGKIINTFSGDTVHDFFGSGGIIEISDDYFVISSPSQAIDSALKGATDAGSVKLINSHSGQEIVSINGDILFDQLGSIAHGSSITALSNGHFVIASMYDDAPAIHSSGSIKLVNGSSGHLISTLYGDNIHDFMGSHGVHALKNGTFIVASPFDDNANGKNAGSVKLIDGSSGLEIAEFIGTHAGDELGNSQLGDQITTLKNANFILSSASRLNGYGLALLIDGSTGNILNSIKGESRDDFIGLQIIEASNEHFILAAPHYDNHALTDSGLVRIYPAQ